MAKSRSRSQGSQVSPQPVRSERGPVEDLGSNQDRVQALGTGEQDLEAHQTLGAAADVEAGGTEDAAPAKADSGLLTVREPKAMAGAEVYGVSTTTKDTSYDGRADGKVLEYIRLAVARGGHLSSLVAASPGLTVTFKDVALRTVDESGSFNFLSSSTRWTYDA